MKKALLFYDHVLDRGGVETHLLGLIEHLRGSYQFVVVSPVSDYFAAKAAGAGAEIIRWPVVAPLSPGGLLRFRELLRRVQPDLIHIHGANAAVPGRVAARIAGIPCLVTVHLPVSLYHGEKQTVRARAGRALYSRIDRLLNWRCTNQLVYVSNQLMQAAIADGHVPAGKALFIPNGIDTARYTCPERGGQIRAKMNAGPGDRVLCFVGRLDRQKGVDILLAALAALGRERLPEQVWIVGDGPERRALEEQARRSGLRTVITFWGYQEDIPAILNAADIFVLPSRYEALPMALIEAAAAGLPLLASDVGENTLLARDGVNGLVVQPDQPGALAQAISALLADAPTRARMGEASRALAQQFDAGQMAERVGELYRGL